MSRPRRASPQTAAVLQALAARRPAWSYGYDLCGELGIKAGTMYPILIRLADRGQVETKWERDVPAGRPPRHLYRLTARGAAAVHALGAATASAPALPPAPNPAPRPRARSALA